uniref:Uncharacterized protein n=1 Tax=Arundo donax TaxID=35708 RepID=A0A0A9HEV9_ARUDO
MIDALLAALNISLLHWWKLHLVSCRMKRVEQVCDHGCRMNLSGNIDFSKIVIMASFIQFGAILR